MKTAPNRLISDGWFLVVIKETPSWPASHVLRMASYIWGGCEKSLYIVHCTFEEAAKSCSRSPELVTLSSGDLKPNPRRELSCMNWFYSSTRHCQPALMEWTGIALWQEVGKVKVLDERCLVLTQNSFLGLLKVKPAFGVAPPMARLPPLLARRYVL